MESHGLPGRIQVTRDVADRVDGKFEFEERGVIDVKGIGPVETLFLVGRREQVPIGGVAATEAV
jgi:hypothetical protein